MIDKDFLRAVIGTEDGWLCLVSISQTNQVRQSFHKSVDALATAAEQRLNLNLYFATHQFSEKERKQERAKHCKTFFLDLDVGPGKPYSSKAEAVTAVKGFCDKNKFPPPNFLVDSGNGIHTYWVIDRALPSIEWSEAAQVFKNMCLNDDLHIDPAVPADSARIMRLPGSLNFKGGKKPARAKRIGPDIPYKNFQSALQLTPETISGIPDYMTGGTPAGILESIEYPASYAKRAIPQCAILRDIAATNGALCQEPLWRTTLLLLHFFEDGDSFVHPLSNGHPGYTQEQTVAKYQKTKAQAESKKLKPPLCATLEHHYYRESPCASCSFHNRIHSPIALGSRGSDASHPPSRYFVKGDGIYKEASEDKAPARVCSVFSLTVEEYEDNGQMQTFLVIHTDEVAPITMDFAKIHDIGAVRAVLGGLINLPKRNLAMFDDLITSWMSDLRTAQNGYTSLPAHVGWGNDWKTFAFSDRVLQLKDGAATSQTLHGLFRLPALNSVRAMQTQGDFTAWQEHVQYLVDTGVPEAHTVLAQAFAAALTGLAVDPPAITMLVSEKSGVGKSTLFRAGNSVWFGKERGIAMRDTENYINGVIMGSHNVPIFWDELQLLGSGTRDDRRRLDEVTAIIFRSLQGMDKGRMDSAANVRTKAVNRPFLIVSSNMPLASMLTEHHSVAPEAMAARTLQVDVTGRPSGKWTGMPLDKHYGVAGERFVRELMVLGKSRVAAILEKIDRELLASGHAKLLEGKGRMWRSNIALTLTAATLVNHFKILKLDIGKIYAALTGATQATARATTKATETGDPATALLEIVHDLVGEKLALITEEVPQKGQRTSYTVSGQLPRESRIWVAPDHKWARVRKSVLHTELRKRGLVAQRVTRRLIDLGCIKERANGVYDPVTSNSLRASVYDLSLTLLEKACVKT